MSTPTKKLSILVVVYNAEGLIQYTLDRILEQKTDQIEVVVLDGASTDGTVDLVKSYGDKIDVVHSEPDQGIYFAMNKAMQLSTGEFVWFINAGDAPAPGAIQWVLENIDSSDIIFGETLFIDAEGKSLGPRSEFTTRKLPDTLTPDRFLKGQVVSHQAFIPRKTLANEYNTTYRISADIDWQISILKKAVRITKSEIPLALYLHGGTSKQQAKRAWKERYQILKEHFGALRTIFAHIAMSLRAISFLVTEKRND